MYINCIECRTNSIPISNNVKYIVSFQEEFIWLWTPSCSNNFVGGADGQPGHWNPLAKSEIYQRASYCKENPFHRPKKTSEASKFSDFRVWFYDLFFNLFFYLFLHPETTTQKRHQKKTPVATGPKDDYYLNLLDWSAEDQLAVGREALRPARPTETPSPTGSVMGEKIVEKYGSPLIKLSQKDARFLLNPQTWNSTISLKLFFGEISLFHLVKYEQKHKSWCVYHTGTSGSLRSFFGTYHPWDKRHIYRDMNGWFLW